MMDVSRLYEESSSEGWWVRLLLPVLSAVWLGELAAPISQLLHGSAGTLRVAPALAGTALFVGVYLWVVVDAIRVRSGLLSEPASPTSTWTPTVIMAALAILVSAFYGPAWLGLFIFGAVGSALRLSTRHAAWTIVAMTVVAGAIGLVERDNVPDLAQGGLLIAGIGASVATVGYTIRTTRELRAARAEVARLAVNEERLRFARDLHDLLGHSLSLVALKCDLADQLVQSAPDRARQEIQEAAGVTRDALREVRETVAGYRRPTLAGELAGAQELLAAAGIGCHVEGQPPELAPEAETALAWTLREAITNVIRHSRAQRCAIRVEHRGGSVELEVSDDGAG
ncbi:MAG TPA: histidine kinase, partial [Chloroflexota bacterium]|nr:histidine kinase [Chloroflexota bacterium]